jgi:hypothetical protein
MQSLHSDKFYSKYEQDSGLYHLWHVQDVFVPQKVTNFQRSRDFVSWFFYRFK